MEAEVVGDEETEAVGVEVAEVEANQINIIQTEIKIRTNLLSKFMIVMILATI